MHGEGAERDDPEGGRDSHRAPERGPQRVRRHGPRDAPRGRAHEQRPPEAGEVAVPVVGELESRVHDPADRAEHDTVVGPDGQARGPAPPQREHRGADGDDDGAAHQEPGRERIHDDGKLVQRGQCERQERLLDVEPDTVRGHREPREPPILPDGREVVIGGDRPE